MANVFDMAILRHFDYWKLLYFDLNANEFIPEVQLTLLALVEMVDGEPIRQRATLTQICITQS